MFSGITGNRALLVLFGLVPILQGQSPGNALQVTPSNLAFKVAENGDTPEAQTITVLSASRSPFNFTVQTDGGPGLPAPAWIRVRPARGTTPGRITVQVDQSNVNFGAYKAHVRISVGDYPNSQPIDVPVSLEVEDIPPHLDVAPAVVRLSAQQRTDDFVERDLLIRNTGGEGPQQFTASVVSSGGLDIQVSPAKGRTQVNVPVFVHLRVSTAGLKPGSYRGVVRIESPAGDANIPVTTFIADTGPVMGLNFSGIRFESRQGNGDAQTRNANVLNLGAPGTRVNWTAEIVSGREWLSLGAVSGSATADTPSRLPLSVRPDAFALRPGAYYALVKVSDPNALNSPQFLTAVLSLAPPTTLPKPDPSPQGLFFTAVAGAPAPAAQPVRVFTSSVEPVAFQAAASTADGDPWLRVNGSNATVGETSTGDVETVSISVEAKGLRPGVYTGEVNFALAGSMRTTNVTLVLQPPAQSANNTARRTAPTITAGCSPARLSVTQTGLASNFTVPAGWPAQLLVRLADDCGDPVLNGQVVAVFNNGDPPQVMQLSNGQIGLYSATWAPIRTGSQVAITARANAPGLESASAVVSGAVADNVAPMLARNGTLNNLNPLVGAPLAPGTVVQIQGAGLAGAAVEPGLIPLPTTFNGSSVIVGGIEAPLYFLSSGQINAQLPTQLKPGQQYQVVVNANGALTLPDTLDLVPSTPGLAAFPDGRIIAQHADFTLVDAANPAAPGEVLILYLVGMGATDPAVGSGSQAPGVEPLARLAIQPQVAIGGQSAAIFFAGLTPGGIGLYQINCAVPASAQPGALDVVVTQNGVSSNTAKLPVQ